MQSCTSTSYPREALTTIGSSLVVLLLFVFASSAQAGPAVCRLLNDPRVMSQISGPGEMALKAQCGQLGAPNNGRGSESAADPAIGLDLPVNNRAADTGTSFTQSEASVARFGNTLVAGFNDAGGFSATGDFSGYARSTNGGFTWTDMGVPTTPLGNVRGVFGDPVLEMDRRGTGLVRTYFANLGQAVSPAGQSIIAVHRSDNFGTSWLQAANASPLAAGADFQDKEWMAVDTRPAAVTGAGNVYVCWRVFGTTNNGIRFSRSTNGGASFTQLAGSLSSGLTTVQGCSVAVDPRNGRVYVAWRDSASNAVRMRISTNFGVSFGTEFTVGSLLPVAETTATCGTTIRTVLLDSEAGATGRAIRSAAFPSMDVNPRNGHVYVTWHRGGTVNNPDIAFARSTTGLAGSYVTTTFPTVGAQFFPSVAVNRAGEVAVMYYSTQNSATNRRIDVYVRRSPDGVVFDPADRITDVSFDRSQTNPNADPIINPCYMGDYNDVEAAAPGHGSSVFNYIWGDNRLTRVVGGVSRPDPDIRFDTD